MPSLARAGRSSSRYTASWRAISSRTTAEISLSCCSGVRPSQVGSSMPAAIWSRNAATRTWKNSSRLVETMAQNLARSSSGMPCSWANPSTRQLNSSQLSSRLTCRCSPSAGATSVTTSVIAMPPGADGRRSLHAVWQTELPLDRDVLALGVAVDALFVAAELRVVAGQQHQPCQRPRPELVEHLVVAPVAVDLPMRRHRPQVDDPGVRSRRDFLDDDRHGPPLYRSLFQ